MPPEPLCGPLRDRTTRSALDGIPTQSVGTSFSAMDYDTPYFLNHASIRFQPSSALSLR